MNRTARRLWIALAILLVTATAGLGAAYLARMPTGSADDPPQVGGPFALTDGAGRRVTDHSYDGYWRLVYFGYTHCPDACPTTLGDLGAALGKLPESVRDHVRVLFVTVDPARDTPAVIGSYVRAFGPGFVGLTGTQAELAPVEASYHVYAHRHDLKDGDYAMDHSSIVYVMRPDGSFAGLLDDGIPPAEMAHRLTDFGV